MKKMLVMLAGVVLVITAFSPADTLTLKDGRTFKGELKSRSEKEVVFDVYLSGGSITMRFKTSDVAAIEKGEVAKPVKPVKPEPAGGLELPTEPKAPPIITYDKPTYYVIPLKGEVGNTILASLLAKSLEDAVRRKPDVVILEVDSPGGLVQEAGKIVDVIRKYNSRVRMVVFTDQALSAAAIFSLATKEIYMKSSGLIGAATAYQPTQLWLPKDIEEKMQSVWRATARSAAETGGHNPLLAEAMIDRQLAIHVVTDGDQKVVKQGRGKQIVSKKGQLLTLTASEAVQCGLSAGTAETFHGLGALLEFPEWTECKGLGTLLVAHWAKVQEKLEDRMGELHRQFVRNMEIAKENAPENYRYKYYVETDRFTPRSQRKWRERSIACARAYRKAMKDVEAAMALTKQFKELNALEEYLEEVYHEVEGIADRVYRNRTSYDVKAPRKEDSDTE